MIAFCKILITINFANSDELKINVIIYMFLAFFSVVFQHEVNYIMETIFHVLLF